MVRADGMFIGMESFIKGELNQTQSASCRINKNGGVASKGESQSRLCGPLKVLPFKPYEKLQVG